MKHGFAAVSDLYHTARKLLGCDRIVHQRGDGPEFGCGGCVPLSWLTTYLAEDASHEHQYGDPDSDGCPHNACFRQASRERAEPESA